MSHNRHVWLKPFLKFLNDAENDALTQIKIHKVSIRFWIVNFVIASLVYFLLPDFWAQASIYYLVSLSLYANFATDYGALIAAEAAFKVGGAVEEIALEATKEDDV